MFSYFLPSSKLPAKIDYSQWSLEDCLKKMESYENALLQFWKAEPGYYRELKNSEQQSDKHRQYMFASAGISFAILFLLIGMVLRSFYLKDEEYTSSKLFNFSLIIAAISFLSLTGNCLTVKYHIDKVNLHEENNWKNFFSDIFDLYEKIDSELFSLRYVLQKENYTIDPTLICPLKGKIMVLPIKGIQNGNIIVCDISNAYPKSFFRYRENRKFDSLETAPQRAFHIKSLLELEQIAKKFKTNLLNLNASSLSRPLV
jgi:hypothetical protein